LQFSNALRKKIEPTTVPLQCEGFEKYPNAKRPLSGRFQTL
jgi:hypothetical protein